MVFGQLFEAAKNVLGIDNGEPEQEIDPIPQGGTRYTWEYVPHYKSSRSRQKYFSQTNKESDHKVRSATKSIMSDI